MKRQGYEEARLQKIPLRCAVQADRETLEVLFLGTGAALPSKYRNVTATYLNMFDKVRLLARTLSVQNLVVAEAMTQQMICCSRPGAGHSCTLSARTKQSLPPCIVQPMRCSVLFMARRRDSS